MDNKNIEITDDFMRAFIGGTVNPATVTTILEAIKIFEFYSYEDYHADLEVLISISGVVGENIGLEVCSLFHEHLLEILSIYGISLFQDDTSMHFLVMLIQGLQTLETIDDDMKERLLDILADENLDNEHTLATLIDMHSEIGFTECLIVLKSVRDSLLDKLKVLYSKVDEVIDENNFRRELFNKLLKNIDSTMLSESTRTLIENGVLANTLAFNVEHYFNTETTSVDVMANDILILVLVSTDELSDIQITYTNVFEELIEVDAQKVAVRNKIVSLTSKHSVVMDEG